MVKEGPTFLRVQLPASGMRQWKLRVVGHWEETLLWRIFPRPRNWRLSEVRLLLSQKSPMVTEKQGGERKLLRADPARPSTFPTAASLLLLLDPLPPLLRSNCFPLGDVGRCVWGGSSAGLLPFTQGCKHFTRHRFVEGPTQPTGREGRFLFLYEIPGRHSASLSPQDCSVRCGFSPVGATPI